MSHCIAYLRVSTKDQDVASQKQSIIRTAIYKEIEINEWIELEMSSRLDQEKRRLDDLRNLQKGDILITSELSRLSRSMIEVVLLVNELVKKGVRVIIVKENIDNGDKNTLDLTQKLVLGIFSSFAEMHRDLISLRTKEGTDYARSQGRIGGRKAGSYYSSIYDKNEKRIKEMLAKKHTLTAIIKEIGYGKVLSLSEYLERKGLRSKEIKGAAIKKLKDQIAKENK